MAGSEWFSIKIASQPVNAFSTLLDEFARAWAAIGAPKGVAMFLASKPGRDQVAWFTPETAQYLASSRIVPGSPPRGRECGSRPM